MSIIATFGFLNSKREGELFLPAGSQQRARQLSFSHDATKIFILHDETFTINLRLSLKLKVIFRILYSLSNTTYYSYFMRSKLSHKNSKLIFY